MRRWLTSMVAFCSLTAGTAASAQQLAGHPYPYAPVGRPQVGPPVAQQQVILPPAPQPQVAYGPQVYAPQPYYPQPAASQWIAPPQVAVAPRQAPPPVVPQQRLVYPAPQPRPVVSYPQPVAPQPVMGYPQQYTQPYPQPTAQYPQPPAPQAGPAVARMPAWNYSAEPTPATTPAVESTVPTMPETAPELVAPGTGGPLMEGPAAGYPCAPGAGPADAAGMPADGQVIYDDGSGAMAAPGGVMAAPGGYGAGGCGAGGIGAGGFGAGYGAGYGAAAGGGCGVAGYGAAAAGFAPGVNPYCTPSPSGWFGGLGGLIMTRDRPNRVYFSADANNLANQNQSGEDVTGDWQGGWEVNFGRQYCGGCAWGVSFWMIDSLEDTSRVGGPLVTPIDVSFLPPLNGRPVGDYFDGAEEHRLYRRNEIYNLELNVFGSPWYGSAQGAFAYRWLAGVRWLRFDESLVFGSVEGGEFFGANGGASEAYYDISVVNNLIGPQIGGVGRWQFLPRMAAYATPKVGLMVNHINHRSQLYTGSGVYGFDTQSNKNDISMLASLDLGLSYQLTRAWYVYGGYRLVSIAGIGLADEQVPFFLNDYPEIRRVDSNGSLLLHGAMFGVGACF